jgi:hypothetical protein
MSTPDPKDTAPLPDSTPSGSLDYGVASSSQYTNKNRTQKQDEIFKVFQAGDLQVRVACWLPEEFKAVVECKTLSNTKQYFQRWFESVKGAAVNEIMQVA